MTYYFCVPRTNGHGPVLVFEDAATIPAGYENFGTGEGDSPQAAYEAWAKQIGLHVTEVSAVNMPKSTLLYIKLKQPWEK